MPVDRHFLYRSADDTFYAFQFDGTAVSDDNEDVSGIATNLAITAAAASDTRIFGFDNPNDTVRVWDLDWNRQSTEEFTPRSTTYRAMACSDTHLIMINSSETAEFYLLSNLSPVTSMDQALGTGRVQGATFAGGFLFILDDQNQRIEKRNADGTALSPAVRLTGLPSQARRTMISTTDRVIIVARETGLSIRYDLNLNRIDSVTFGQLNSWFAGLTTYAAEVPPAVPGATSIATTLGSTTIDVVLSEAEANRSPILRYEYRYAAGATVSSATAWTETGLDFTISSLQANTQYTIEARAVNAIGDGPTVSVTVSTLAAPTVPDAVTISQVSTTSDSFTVTFVQGSANRSPITRIEYRYGETISPTAQWSVLAADATEFTVTELVPETNYQVEIRAVNAVGAGPSVSRTLRTAVAPPALGIEAIDEQFITIGTEDYDLVINITGQPDTAKAKGHMEGFGQHWDAVQDQLHIKSEEVTRLINGVNWDIEVVKDMQTLMGQVAYNVVKAAPIFATLETLHLYKGVPINFDIIIQNIPPLLIPNAELLGLKSELLEYGINVKGEISATDNFAFSAGNVSIIVPSENGADTIYNYGYEIEDGSPPQIMSAVFIAKGGYGILEFPDVTHALGYGWRLGTDETWNVFDSTREVINPDEVEVIPGNLEVTIKFPNIGGASSYAYRLESATHTVDWTSFVGTLENGFIRTIIPNLQEGVTYDLHIRVDQPWEGVPITIPITGGRTCYTLQINFTGGRDDQWLYIYHTGHQSGSHASRIKRLLVPASLSHLERGGLTVDRDGNVYIIQSDGRPTGEKAVYTFNKATIDAAADGSRLTQDMINPFPTAAIRGTAIDFNGMDFYDGNLYMYLRAAAVGWEGVQVFSVPTTDGAVLARSTSGNRWVESIDDHGDVSVTDESFFYTRFRSSRRGLWHRDREFLTGTAELELYDAQGRNRASLERDGFDVIDNDTIYSQVRGSRRLNLYRINPEVDATRHILDFWLELPAGLTYPKFLSVLE